MKSLFQEFKIIFFLFIFFFIILFLFMDGGTTFIILGYQTQQVFQWLKYEITRPPFFINSLALSPNNSKYSITSHLEHLTSIPPYSTSSVVMHGQKYISTTPSSALSVSSPTIPPEATKENLLIIPKFKIKAPIKVVSRPNLSLIYRELRKGVVLYPGSSIPGRGYSIIIGHSSQYPWRPGNYKRVFSLLTELKKGDKIYVYWQQKLLVFQVVEKKIFLPWPKGSEMTETVFPPQNKPILILQSCWPVGVAYKRIAVKTVLIK